jgi:hypothetical protein
MHMIRHAIDRHARSANATHYTRDVFLQFIFDRGRDQILTMLGAKDDVIEELRVSPGHAFTPEPQKMSPLRGFANPSNLLRGFAPTAKLSRRYAAKSKKNFDPAANSQPRSGEIA